MRAHLVMAGALLCAAPLGACGGAAETEEPMPEPTAGDEGPVAGTFGDDVAFLRAHLPDLVELSRGEARVAVAPSYQGRVMTSTAGGDAGASFGWINRELIESGETTPHMNAFGGEDRFWLGPEGGQYGLYFPVGAAFEFEQWQVPAAIDTEAWAITNETATEVSFGHRIEVTNHSGAPRTVDVVRTVRLLDPAATEPAIEGVSAVAYETVNRITNAGDEAWTAETGLVSIWILSMYNPSPATTVVVPFRADGDGPIVNAAYFGEVPPERLAVNEQSGVVFFRADGQERTKIGVPHPRARPILGSWDAAGGALTLVRYTLPDEAPSGYVNSMWEQQEAPYGGDVVNSYNDGPPEPGAEPMGPFYELESSSPAAALAPGESLEHVHRTFHLTGDRAALDAIARAHLGVGLDAIESAFGS